MKTILLTLLLIVLCTCTLSAQKTIFLKIDTLSDQSLVLEPLINNKPFTDNGKPVYTKRNFGEFVLRVYRVLVNTIHEDVWNIIGEKEKKELAVFVAFGVDGDILEVKIFTSKSVFQSVPEVEWNEVCKEIRKINVLPYISINDYDKENFTYSKLLVSPFLYAKRFPEKLK